MSANDETSFEPLLSDEEVQKVIRGPLPPGDYYLFGSDACVEGAILAGCRYYAGYPITPASEIMERSAQRMPQVGGRFIQMEDEISSACSLIGASWAGKKAMTATSGPGFSLMMEAVSFAIMSETPFVIVNVQRPGPGQGYINSSQEDVMQARWGHHGGGPLIALAPASVQEMYDFTIAAFNYAEEWRVPVILLADETVAHMREKLTVPPKSAVRIFNRVKPQDLKISPADFLPYDPLQGTDPAHARLGRRIPRQCGRPRPSSRREHQQIQPGNALRLREPDPPEDRGPRRGDRPNRRPFIWKAAGTWSWPTAPPTRSAIEAVLDLRSQGWNDLGFLRFKTLWPVPEKKIRSLVGQVENVFFPEMNMGYFVHPLKEALRDRVKQFVSIPSLGQLHSPDQIIAKIKEVTGK